jgi:hypothetical protein
VVIRTSVSFSGKSLVLIPACRLSILTVFAIFPQSFQANAAVMS